jgi:hypothetical protein
MFKFLAGFLTASVDCDRCAIEISDFPRIFFLRRRRVCVVRYDVAPIRYGEWSILKVIWSENGLFFLHEVTGGKKIGFGGGWSKVLIDGASVKEGLRKAFHQ